MAMKSPAKPNLPDPIDRADHVLGAPGAAITIVEYGDFECPNCKQAAPVVKSLVERFPKDVRLVYRHFPLEDVHPHALLAAQAAEAAGGQGRFWEMHDLLFENQNHLKLNALLGYAQRLELDMTRFKADLEDEIYLQRVREHIDGALQNGVRSTPTFFVNGTLCDVSFGLQSLVDVVEAAVKR
jgi:protein-disulfide isomerase